MTGKTTDKTQKTPEAPGLKAIQDVQQAGFKSASALGNAWAEALSNLGVEVFDFVAERVKEDVRTQHQLMHAKSLQEVQKIQGEFVQKALDQYSAETGRLVELSQAAMAKLPGTKIMPD
ncbi:phasin family protein [Litoreibacter arenae]|uniref:Phasin domain-containing protein n=1 Tax=Litoreibacter arenae DSM 19593 TaxID=1123360 RepID=S9RQ06_9RHOB|nr:phasin family protein [Litoreibacter arenae]EPX80125.1 hypothetical protein thalar_01463 [Litoreibacter arenae DSM 19593]